MSTELGYKTHHGSYETEINSAKIKLDQFKHAQELNAQFNPNKPVVNPTEDKSEPNSGIFPQDLMKGMKFQMPDIKAPTPADTSKVMETGKEISTTNDRTNVQAAEGTYREMDRQIKAEFIAEMKNHDPAAAGVLEASMGQPGGTSMIVEAAKLTDPGVGDLYSALNSLMARNPNDQRVGEAMEKTLTALHARTEAAEVNASPRNPLPKNHIDWKKFENVQQVEKFMSRDIDNDPVIRQARRNEFNLDLWDHEGEKLKQYAAGELDTITNEQIIAAVASGNQGLAANLVGDKNKADELMAGKKVEELFKPASFDSGDDAKYFSSEVPGMKGLKFEIADVIDMAGGARKTDTETPKYDMLKPPTGPDIGRPGFAV